jgi:hypothetical protein
VYRALSDPLPADPGGLVVPGLHPDFEVKAIHGEYSAVVFSALASEARLPLHIDADNALAVEMVLMGVMAVLGG